MTNIDDDTVKCMLNILNDNLYDNNVNTEELDGEINEDQFF